MARDKLYQGMTSGSAADRILCMITRVLSFSTLVPKTPTPCPVVFASVWSLPVRMFILLFTPENLNVLTIPLIRYYDFRMLISVVVNALRQPA